MVRRPKIASSVSLALALAVAASPLMGNPALAAASRSVAMGPVIDGDGDDESRAIAASLADAVRSTSGHRVIDPSVAEGVSGYRAEGAPVSPATTRAAGLMRAAKEQFFSFKYDGALGDLSEAIAALTAAGREPAALALLRDAHLASAMVLSAKGMRAEARAALESAADVDPMLDLREGDFPPSLVEEFSGIKDARGSLPSGRIEVAARPEGAEVLLNGMIRGIAPLSLGPIPAGEYSLQVRANRYAPDTRVVAVKPGQAAKVSARLKWEKGGRPGGAREDEALAAVRDGVALASALRADRAVLIDADIAGGGAMTLSARAVDREMGAGFRPVTAKIDGAGGMDRAIAAVAQSIVEGLDADAIADPAASLDPLGEGDAALMARQRKPITRQPLFWGAVGTAAAGAIVGGILAAMSGGSKTGSLQVNFR